MGTSGIKKECVFSGFGRSCSEKWWLFDATPDIRRQLHDFSQRHNREYPYLPEGVFITHAHIGHYTGLMEFGKEVMNTKQVKVYVLPKLKTFWKAMVHGASWLV